MTDLRPLPVDRRPSTWQVVEYPDPAPLPSWLTTEDVVQPEPPVRDDPTAYVPPLGASERLVRRFTNALLRKDRVGELIAIGQIEAEARR